MFDWIVIFLFLAFKETFLESINIILTFESVRIILERKRHFYGRERIPASITLSEEHLDSTKEERKEMTLRKVKHTASDK